MLPSLLLPRSAPALLGLGAAVLSAGVRVAVAPLLVAPLFDRVFVVGDFGALPRLLLLGSVLALLGSLALWAQDALLGAAAARVSAAWRAGLYRSLLARPHPPGATSGGLTGRVLADLREVETYLQFGLGTLAAESATLLGSLAYLLASNAQATVYLLGLALPLALVLVWVGRRIKKSALRAQVHLEETSAHLQEGLKQQEVVRAFGLSGFLLGRFAGPNRGAAAAQIARARWAALQTPLAQVLGFGALAALLLILTRSVQAGAMSLGEVSAYVVLLALLATPAQLLPRGYALLQGARAASQRLHALRTPPEPAPEPLAALPPRRPELRLEQVSFSYGDAVVLAGVSAELRGPALVAVRGPSGAGKTTLLRLLLGLARPSAGRVLLAGAPLDRFPDAALRERLAYVPQDTALFRGTLGENLRLGRDYPDAALHRTLRSVGLEQLARARGLSAALSEDGGGLSGGQRQRLAVARALLSDPDVLLLDEPSANLDADSEAVLVRVLKAQAERRLVVVVAHRPALVAAADAVFELSGGRLRETVRA